MKRKLTYVLLCVAALATGCLKEDNDTTTPIVQPQGKFAGKFWRIHRTINTNKTDTLKLDVQLELTNNNFQITGDTSKHAGSKGTFDYNNAYIQWTDSTVPTGSNSLKLPKIHLHGLYQYNYNGSDFRFAASNDTLFYYYELKKTL